MKSTNSGDVSTRKKVEPQLVFLSLWTPTGEIEFRQLIGAYLRSGKKAISVETASHKEWKEFIAEFVNLEGDDTDTWTFEDRVDVLNFLYAQDSAKPEIFIPLV